MFMFWKRELFMLSAEAYKTMLCHIRIIQICSLFMFQKYIMQISWSINTDCQYHDTVLSKNIMIYQCIVDILPALVCKQKVYSKSYHIKILFSCLHGLKCLTQGHLWSLLWLTHCSLETSKRVIGKQCRPRSDAAECGIWSGSPLFANSSTIFL